MERRTAQVRPLSSSRTFGESAPFPQSAKGTQDRRSHPFPKSTYWALLGPAEARRFRGVGAYRWGPLELTAKTCESGGRETWQVRPSPLRGPSLGERPERPHCKNAVSSTGSSTVLGLKERPERAHCGNAVSSTGSPKGRAAAVRASPQSPKGRRPALTGPSAARALPQ